MNNSLIIKVIYPSGPTGIKLFLVPGKTGKLIVFSRLQFSKMSKEDKDIFFDHVGVYILEETEKSRFYIGEGDTILARLNKHHQAKEKEWDRGFAFSSQNGEMNKAHIQYVESMLIEKLLAAKLAGLADADNVRAETKPTLDIFDETTSKDYLDQVIQLCRVIDLNVFNDIDNFRESESTELKKDVFVMRRSGSVIGKLILGENEYNGKYILLKGSKLLSITEPNACFPNQRALDELRQNNVVDDKTGELLKDRAFDNPSRPGSLVCGNTCNGWESWKHEVTGVAIREFIEKS